MRQHFFLIFLCILLSSSIKVFSQVSQKDSAIHFTHEKEIIEYDTVFVSDTIHVVDTVRIEETKKPLVLDTVRNIEPIKKKWQTLLQLSFDVGAVMPSYNYTGTQKQSALVAKYVASTKAMLSTQFGIGVGFVLGNFFMDTGLGVSILKQQFQHTASIQEKTTREFHLDTTDIYYADNVPIAVVDTLWQTQRVEATRLVSAYNYFTFIEIPLNFGYNFYFHKLVFGVFAGSNFSFSFKQTGYLINPLNLNEVSTLSEAGNTIKMLMISAGFGCKLAFPITNKLLLSFSPHILYGLTSLFSQDEQPHFKISSTGASLGLIYQFK